MFTVQGTASVIACRSIIKRTFFCKTSGCPFFDQPSLHGEFFGFPGIFHTAVDTGMLKCFDCIKPLSPAMRALDVFVPNSAKLLAVFRTQKHLLFEQFRF